MTPLNPRSGQFSTQFGFASLVPTRARQRVARVRGLGSNAFVPQSIAYGMKWNMIARSGGFAPETCIRTKCGDRPVHALACGDLVLARLGELIAVREVTPVSMGPRSRLIIPANAFIAGPSKPLCIALHKAVCVRIIEDLLVDLEALAVDSTIERIDDERDYFDLVLERRVILLADGLPPNADIDQFRRQPRPACEVPGNSSMS